MFHCVIMADRHRARCSQRYTRRRYTVLFSTAHQLAPTYCVLMMSNRMIYTTIAVWFAMITALVGSAVSTGVHLTAGTSALAALVGLMPPAMMLRLRATPRVRAAVKAS
jgi:hypothetical protein